MREFVEIRLLTRIKKEAAMTLNLTVTTSSLNCKKYFKESSDSFTQLCRALYEKKFFDAITMIKNGANVSESSKVLINSQSSPCEFKEIIPLEVGLFRLNKIKNKIIVLGAVRILCANMIEISKDKKTTIPKAQQEEVLRYYEILPEEITKCENLVKEVETCIALIQETLLKP